MIYHKVGGPFPDKEYPWHVHRDDDEARTVDILAKFKTREHALAFAGLLRILKAWDS